MCRSHWPGSTGSHSQSTGAGGRSERCPSSCSCAPGAGSTHPCTVHRQPCRRPARAIRRDDVWARVPALAQACTQHPGSSELLARRTKSLLLRQTHHLNRRTARKIVAPCPQRAAITSMHGAHADADANQLVPPQTPAPDPEHRSNALRDVATSRACIASRAITGPCRARMQSRSAVARSKPRGSTQVTWRHYGQT